MTSRQIFIIVVGALCLVQCCLAIYDPNVESTTKPPKRREFSWFSKVEDEQTTISADKLMRPTEWDSDSEETAQIPLKPNVPNAGATKTRSSWNKTPNSKVQREKEIMEQSMIPDSRTDRLNIVNALFGGNQNRNGENNNLQNITPFNTRDEPFNPRGNKFIKKPTKSSNRHFDMNMDPDQYEGVTGDTKKPHKEKLNEWKKQKMMVAKLDGEGNPSCPDNDVIGQFVYPRDCKYFVNCWKGRAVIQPCAPGTLFNPDTLECDFPHKVKCYGSEFSKYRTVAASAYHSGEGRLGELCAHLTGMIPHPTNCSQFIQCANGAPIVMDCGPGTAFNPTISVCDWPRNVPGCEVAVVSDGEEPSRYLTPPKPDYGRSNDYDSKSKYAVKKVVCPKDYTGLLPHPDTCKKFLQCANGATYIMDCGPGTAFNPSLSVCDWPYNVPGCKDDDSSKLESTRPNHNYDSEVSSSRDDITITHGNNQWHAVDGPNYHHHQHHHHQHPPHESWNSPGRHPEENTELYRPTWRPIPQYDKPSTPKYFDTDHWHPETQEHGVGKIDVRMGESESRTSGNRGNSYGSYDRQGQSSQSSYGTSYGNPPNGDSFGSSYEHHRPDVSFRPPHSRNHQYQPHHHGLDGTDIYNRQPQSENPYSPPIPSSKLEPPHKYPHHQSPYNPESLATMNPSEATDDNYKPYPIESQRIPNHREIDPYSTDETRRPSQSKGTDRRPYGRIDPDFAIMKPDKQTPSMGGNVYVDSTFELSEQKPQVPWDYHSKPGSSRPSNNNSPNWNQPEMPSTGSRGSETGSWHPSRLPHDSEDVPPTKGPELDDKFREWIARTNIQEQSTFDRVADSKINQWSHNTDIHQESKGQPGTGSKNLTPSLRPTAYPEGIYVNVNGTKGHYITKDFEIHQGHSKTKSYSHVKPPGPRPSNKTQSSPESRYPIYRGSDPSLYERAKSNITTQTHKAARSYPTTETATETEYDSNVPSVSIENDNEDTRNFPKKDSPTKNMKKSFKKVVQPEIEEIPEGFEVDILEDKEVWKPRLVFENKTKTDQNKTSDESSVIMKINQRRSDVDIFFTEAAPLRQEEPTFPVYYVPPVRSLSHAPKPKSLTPVSGQVIRLRGGSGPRDGYVEVQGTQPGWGVVCDTRNGWTLKEAHIVCRQLGYTRGAEMAWQGRSNGNANSVPTWIAANFVTCFGNETKFQSCKFTHGNECRVDRDAIGVRCLPNRVAHCRKDEIPHLGQCYHLAEPDTGLNHAEALEYCTNRQSSLIDITTQAENDFLSEWLLQGYPEVASVMTSGVGLTMMNRTMWLWDDSNRAKFKFTKWWPGWMHDARQPPWTSSRPACIVMKRKFPCHDRPDSICVADYFFWDVEDCASSNKGHSFVCKRPYEDIGCVYGKGNQYSGNANVTSSGKPCLPWADDSVAHPLYVNVLNPDEREKLKGHNYCRNPNPNKESRPWCFTGPYGEREYCDIPSCGRIESKRLIGTGQCKPKHFECLPGECIPSPWVCDGEEDCTNGADERTCGMHMDHFHKYANQKLEGYDMEKWLNTPLKTCALRCKEADFTCRSFAHKADGNVCLLSESNIGMTGALQASEDFDYYEMIERSINCDRMFVCNNRKCVNQTQVCDGKNDCNDRSDENVCTIENLGYEIRLAGSESKNEGRIEVKVLGLWGQVCDDGFGMIDADVICKELGFKLGAQEVRPGGFYGNLEPPTRFMVDQLKCRGNETSLRECDFDGWGVHNCQPEEAVGVVCKTAVDSCKSGHWKCDNSPVCIPVSFICDDVADCPDRSDESPDHCNATFKIRLVNGSSPLEGRVEVRHHGVWGTVCDDDFSNATAAVVCRSLGYGGVAIAKKNSFFGGGEGPIWLDQVSCHGNETQLYRCEHNHWGQHNCEHNEDAGVICTMGDVNGQEVN